MLRWNDKSLSLSILSPQKILILLTGEKTNQIETKALEFQNIE